MEKTIKTTPEQFEEFKKEVLRLQPLMGLNNWHIDFTNNKIELTSLARTVADPIHAVCTMNLNSEYNDYTLAENLNPTYLATHELLHLLLFEIYFIAWERKDMSIQVVTKEEEHMIRKLEKIINI